MNYKEQKHIVEDYTFVADLHCHSIASSHAYSTITELVGEAKRIGLIAIASTDHGPQISDGAHEWHFYNMRILPRIIDGVSVIRGIEANILDISGKIDLPEYIAGRLDLVIASMHEPVIGESLTVEESTAAWLAVAENPRVDIIGHSGIPHFEYDYERVIPVFKEKGKAVEINEGTFLTRSKSIPNCYKIAELCKKYEVPIVVSSDAHYHSAVGKFEKAKEILRSVNFPKELIINSSVKNMNRFFEPKGIRF